ncbi:WD repeat and HMG-box DNA-binding protein 1 [Ceratitis capitata]|uniref:WD repeat and HMG-box DNA-binding protein 1 n=1 Tax=Ceratitis capitata TaxID=7213 RepID=UPI00032A08B7|nr:WD repeat and HMG-box DNA-binding protein 1 [Ceratitis capitata]
MAYERSSLRYAHTNGYTSLTFTEDDESIITCGSDGDIRVWKGIDDDDPSSTCLGEFVMCIAHSSKRLLASTDRNTVQSYTYPELESDGTLMRFTAPVTCLRVHEKYIAAGSDDTNIKVLKSDDNKSEMHLQGHSGPVLALDICYKGELLASIAGDGYLKIWKLSEEGAEVKSIAGLPKINSFENAEHFGTPSFEPQNSKSLAYVHGKEIIVLNTDTWEVKFTLSDDRVKGEYTCCRFSKDGQYLAAGTDKGEISVYDFMRKQALKTEPPSSECQAITCISWNAAGSELAYCDVTGQLGTLFRTKGSNGAVFADGEAEEVDFGDIEFNNEDNDDLISGSGFDGVDENHIGGDDDDDDGISIERLKSQVMRNAVGYSDGQEENTRDSLPKSMHSEIEPQVHVKTFKQQPAFQPGATPTHLEHRYLVWNDVGIVTAHTEGADGSLDVEFHDASVHHSLHIPNYSNHNMASLSASVLALSAENATKLVCIALAASGNKEWSVSFPDCESTEALVATNKLVGVATSMQFLRLFTVMGTQREIISIPGPVVALAGHEDRILVVYHSAPPGTLQQHLSAMLIQTAGMQLRTQHLPVPLTPERRLTWLGFSDCGSPVFSDSMGLIQLYSLKSKCWYPICDTLKQSQSVSNNYFVIAVSERSQIIQAVLCRGSSYPMTNPRPMTQELTVQLPVCDADVEKSEIEDTLVRASIMNVDNADKTIKETAIKLFALACRTEVEMRAKELIETIACPELLLLAVKYASKLGRIHLSDRLSELMPQLEEQNQRERQELQEFEQQHNTTFSPLVRSQSPSLGHSSMSGNRIAPKAMELTHARRASLKRFAMSNSPVTFGKKSMIMSTAERIASPTPTPANSETIESQENIPDNNVEKLDANSDELKDVTRTPLNAVNPFAAKRKHSEVDPTNKGGVLINGGKLKIAKK